MLNGVVFLDIRKAFDSIDHSILLKKMNEQFGIYGAELKWFESYLTKRQQVCFINGHTSSPRQITCGVPQGSILGPLLFLLYINDMPNCLKSTTPCLYADDTEIFASSFDYDTLVKNLNYDLKNIHTWLTKNKLQHHPTKTKLMFIGSPYNLKNRIGEATVFFGGKPVPLTHSFESLGVEIDENLNWEKHIDKIDNRRNKSKAVFMYKVLNDHAAPGLKESLHKRNVTQNTYNLRNSENDLTLPKPRTEYLKRSFKYSGVMLWNDLSSAAKSADTLDCFKKEIGASC